MRVDGGGEAGLTGAMEAAPPAVEQLDPKAAFAAAVERFMEAHPDRPGAALADLIGCSRANVSQVLQRKGACPTGWVVRLSAAVGMDRAALRPDLYAEAREG